MTVHGSSAPGSEEGTTTVRRTASSADGPSTLSTQAPPLARHCRSRPPSAVASRARSTVDTPYAVASRATAIRARAASVTVPIRQIRVMTAPGQQIPTRPR